MANKIQEENGQFRVMTDGVCYDSFSTREDAEISLKALNQEAEIEAAIDEALDPAIDALCNRFGMNRREVIRRIRQSL